MKILFLCTHNSCRSILSEALFNHMAPEGFAAYSAGSFPSGDVNPFSIIALKRAGVSTAGLHSKSSDVFRQLAPDIVITVCDKAAGEACPLYLGKAVRTYWGLNDPSKLTLDATLNQEQVNAAFDACVAKIQQRISALLALPLEVLFLDKAQLQAAVDGIGKL